RLLDFGPPVLLPRSYNVFQKCHALHQRGPEGLTRPKAQAQISGNLEIRDLEIQKFWINKSRK
ncbi:MAG: hypothetical protein VXY35_07115, partial [Candidatus Thermoplasmatota archaeon]|nr:hypothetical protein [Candidatus Thermoplasmatota archaeon]